MTEYEVPLNAMYSAAVAVTFEYDKRFRRELSTAPPWLRNAGRRDTASGLAGLG
jgi:hypothetical protein